MSNKPNAGIAAALALTAAIASGCGPSNPAPNPDTQRSSGVGRLIDQAIQNTAGTAAAAPDTEGYKRLVETAPAPQSLSDEFDRRFLFSMRRPSTPAADKAYVQQFNTNGLSMEPAINDVMDSVEKDLARSPSAYNPQNTAFLQDQKNVEKYVEWALLAELFVKKLDSAVKGTSPPLYNEDAVIKGGPMMLVAGVNAVNMIRNYVNSGHDLNEQAERLEIYKEQLKAANRRLNAIYNFVEAGGGFREIDGRIKMVPPGNEQPGDLKGNAARSAVVQDLLGDEFKFDREKALLNDRLRSSAFNNETRQIEEATQVLRAKSQSSRVRFKVGGELVSLSPDTQAELYRANNEIAARIAGQRNTGGRSKG